MKYFIIIVLTIVLSFSFVSISFAASYSAYGSVTSSTSQINYLIETMLNQNDVNYFDDWVALRTGDQEYCLFYNIDGLNSTAIKLRYYGTTSGYTTVWHFAKSYESNFSYNPNNYTIVGNVSESLGSSAFRDQFYRNVLLYCVPLIFIVLSFFVFRIRKRGRGINFD